MNINSNVAQPSFKARLIENEPVAMLRKSMTKEQTDSFNRALDNISKVAPNDVLEIQQTFVHPKRGAQYALKNITNGKIQTVGKLFPAMITEVLNQASVKDSQMYTCFFNGEAENSKLDVKA